MIRVVAPAWRRVLGAALVAAPFSACSLVDQFFTTPTSAKLAAAANDYWYWSERYTEKCGAKPAPATCDGAYVTLMRTRADLEKANDALKRGGKLPLQMSRLRDGMRATAKAVGGL